MFERKRKSCSTPIILAKDSTDFVLKWWFDAQPWKEGLASPHQLVIGLNPVGCTFRLYAPRCVPALKNAVVPMKVWLQLLRPCK